MFTFTESIMKYAMLFTFCLAAHVAAQEPKPFPEIIDAKKAFDKEKVELDHRYGEEITKARARYVERLTDIRIKAVTAGNVDLAQDALFRAREVEKELRAFQPPERAPEVLEPPMKPARFEIIAARWGAHDGWLDATEKLKSAVVNNRLVLPKNTHDSLVVMVGNPSKLPKNLVIVYWLNGKIVTRIFTEQMTVSIP